MHDFLHDDLIHDCKERLQIIQPLIDIYSASDSNIFYLAQVCKE